MGGKAQKFGVADVGFVWVKQVGMVRVQIKKPRKIIDEEALGSHFNAFRQGVRCSSLGKPNQ